MTTPTTPAPAAMPTDFLGAAVYAEFTRRMTPSATGDERIAVTQMIFVPETNGPSPTPFSTYRRRITSEFPRRNWKFLAGGLRSGRLVTTAVADGTPPADVNFRVAQAMLSSVTGYIDSMARGGWLLRKQPIVVEIDASDLDSIRLGKTPYKILGRITRARKALGFPKEPLDPDPTPSAV